MLCGMMAGPAAADSIQLTGAIRDFRVDHPDMQRSGPNYKVVHNMVQSQLGADHKPVLNSADMHSGYRVESVETFDQWFRDVPEVNITTPYMITLDNGQDEAGGIYTFAIEKPVYFFPIDGLGWGDKANAADGKKHNFYFTYEIHTSFTYTDPADRDHALVFSFTGDDDVWVFINGKLAVDIGGVHGQRSAAVNLDEQAAALGLTPGGQYKLDFFFAERHTSESNFRIETTIQLEDEPPATISPLYD